MAASQHMIQKVNLLCGCLLSQSHFLQHFWLQGSQKKLPFSIFLLTLLSSQTKNFSPFSEFAAVVESLICIHLHFVERNILTHSQHPVCVQEELKALLKMLLNLCYRFLSLGSLRSFTLITVCHTS